MGLNPTPRIHLGQMEKVFHAWEAALSLNLILNHLLILHRPVLINFVILVVCLGFIRIKTHFLSLNLAS